MRVKTSAALDNHYRLPRFQGAGDLLMRNPARMRQMRRGALTFIAGALLVQPAHPQAATIHEDSFESGGIQSSIWNASRTDGCSATVQNGDAAHGRHYLRSSLTANSPSGGNYRCEQNAIGLGMTTQLGETVYYGISYRMPAATLYDPLSDDTLTQWHHQPTTNPNCHHMLSVENNILEWQSNGCGSVGGSNVTVVSPIPKDTWIRFCLKAKWAVDSSGELKMWVNPTSEGGTPVYSFNGQTLPDAYTNIAKFKIGNYKTKWRTNNPPANMASMSPRIFDHDDVRVGSSFAAACGGGSVQSAPAVPEPPVSVAVD